MLRDLTNWGIQDWDQHTFHHAVPRAALLEHGELPLWNPYYRSGVPLLANPESRVLAPTFFLVLGFGEIVGLKLEIFVHLLIALVGMQLLLRDFGIGRLSSIAGSFVFAFSGWFTIHLTVGHVWALDGAYLPWVMFGYRRALDAPIWTLPTAVALAWMFLGGGVYPVLIAGFVLVATAGCSAAISRERWLPHVASLALIVALALPLAAVKLLPSAELMLRHPRATDAGGGYTPGALWNAVVDRDQALVPAMRERPEEFNRTPVHEGLYLGVLPLLLFLYGSFAERRRAAPLVAATLLIVWLTLGTTAWPSLWSALHGLPLFDNLRLPQRFGIGAVLLVSVVAALGMDALSHRILYWTRMPLAASGAVACVGLMIVADLILVGSRTLDDAFPIEPISVVAASEFRQYRRAPRYDTSGFVRRPANPLLATLGGGMYPSFLANRGSTLGYEIVPAPTHAQTVSDPGYRGELHLARGPGRAAYTHWSPNRLEIDVHTESDDLLVVNQNFDPGWQIREPPERRAVAHEGLLAVPVTKSDRRVALYYRPTSFMVGALISGLTALGLVAYSVSHALGWHSEEGRRRGGW